MSWSDIFPILTDDLVKDYQTEAAVAERDEYEQWLGVQKKFNVKRSSHLVSVSVFWKNSRLTEPDLPALTRNLLIDADKRGLVLRHNPWDHYVLPVLEGTKRLFEKCPQVSVRVYLANDLEFLVCDFVDAGCEVFLMKSSSIRHNPGALWRFLALEEKNRLVTISDSDRFHDVESDIRRTEEINRTGHSFWRTPVCVDRQGGRIQYRPIMATQCGSTKGFRELRLLMEALIWNTINKRIPTTAKTGICQGVVDEEIVGTDWPNYGFDEWFLQTALYPRLVSRPLLTLIQAGSLSRFLPFDIEYAMWANPNSELVTFGSESNCCPPQFPVPKPKRKRSANVLLTGIWRLKNRSDVILINELIQYANIQDLPVMFKPVIHLENKNLWGSLPQQLREQAIVWEELRYNVSVQDHIMQAVSFGTSADWIWQADSDERVDFLSVGGLKKAILRADREAADYINGEWIDRIRHDGMLVDIQEDTPLHRQFPEALLLTRYFQCSLDTKVALHRNDCITRVGNHGPHDQSKVSTYWSIPIWHFKWHSDFYHNQRAKITADKNAKWIYEFKEVLKKFKKDSTGVYIDKEIIHTGAKIEVKQEHLNGFYPINYND